MGFYEKCQREWREYKEYERQRELRGEKPVSTNNVMFKSGYDKETEDAIIDIANGRQPKIHVMFDRMDFDEMLMNVRKYGRKGIYMMTEARKAYYESIGIKLEDK